MQPFIKICFASFPNNIVFPQCPDILSNGQRRKCSDNRIADTVVVEIPFPGFRNLLTEIARVSPQPIYDKDLFQQGRDIFSHGRLAHTKLFAQLLVRDASLPS